MIHRSPGLGLAVQALNPLDTKMAIVYAGAFFSIEPGRALLQEVSDWAALLVPPLTIVFLIIRIYLAVKGRDKS